MPTAASCRAARRLPGSPAARARRRARCRRRAAVRDARADALRRRRPRARVRAPLGLEGVLAGRPFIEGHVRRRVRALPGVTLVERRAVTGLETANGRVAGVRADAGDALATADGRVTGVRTAAGMLPADLVVWAAGRGASSPARRPRGAPRDRRPLREHGGSGCRRARSAATARCSYRRAPGNPRCLFLFAQDDGGLDPVDRRLRARAPPAARPRGLRGLRGDRRAAGRPLRRSPRPCRWTEIAIHAFPAGVRRHPGPLPAPGCLLAGGDGTCPFNPLFGQGMTVAAAEAVALRECLAAGNRGPRAPLLRRRPRR